jgi:hypothetical protein
MYIYIGSDDGSPEPPASEPFHISIPFESHAYESILTTVNDLHRYILIHI